MKADDATLDPYAEKQVRKYADLLLKKASAYGRFPTPISDLVDAAGLEIARENALDRVFLGGLYRSLPNSFKLAPDHLKKALGKVMGLLDRRDRTVHIDKDLHLLVHSDRGCQYTSAEYRRALADRRAVASYSRKGNCWDNAPMESFFASLKKELVHRVTFATRADAERAVFEYIEVFYNRVRRHSTLGYVAPAAFETGQP